VYTGTEPTAPVALYQLRTNQSYRELVRFFERHPSWEATTGWNRRRFLGYRQERLKLGLTTPYFKETNHGWVQVAEPHWPLTATPTEERLFIPSIT
jgi:hypothetical protein